MNLIQLFDVSLQARATQPALQWGSQTFTFGEIDAASNRLAHALAARGVTQGDRVAVYLANCPDFIHLFLAVLKLGAIFLPINILYRDRELTHILSDASPRLLVDAALLPSLLADAAALPSLSPHVTIGSDDIAALVYTSGTTGLAKGAMLTHNNFAANAASLNTAWQLSASDRLLLALPLFHVHGLANGIHCWLTTGMTLRLLERFEASRAAEEFLSFRPTVFFGVPTMYVRLMDCPAAIGASIRLFVCGSAPLPAQLLEDFRLKFGSTILERYGMTETLMNISNPYAGERRPGAVGLPLPGVSATIIDGEVYIRGANVFAGYWGRPEATSAAFSDGWFRTGDLGSLSPDGYFTLSGRKSDLIIVSGFNVYPREIEEFLLDQPGVREAAVVAESDPVKGEIPIAWLVLDPGTSTASLAEKCRHSLASFKVPRRFHTIDALPRNALGKVQKHLLPRK
ncbi:MAG: class I adenylate-forming enzyme family protein [Acidobacteriota bacterium]